MQTRREFLKKGLEAAVALAAATAISKLAHAIGTPNSVDPEEAFNKAMKDYASSFWFTQEGRPNLYFIMQEHVLNEEIIPENLKQAALRYNNDDARLNRIQFDIGKVIAYLHKNHQLGVIVSEGVDSSEDYDIRNPFDAQSMMGLEKHAYIMAEIFGGNDQYLRTAIEGTKKSGFHDAAMALASLEPDIYLTGFEDKKKHAEVMTLAAKLISKQASPQDKQRYLALQHERSMDAVDWAQKHAADLYNAGKIANKDAAIIIDGSHLTDYKKEILLSNDMIKELPYSPVLIVPHGVNVKGYNLGE